MKNILILGGTQFIGRNLVNRLLTNRNLEVTLFNRQKTGADLFPEVQKIRGDRETDDLQKIATKSWDVVIDVSCYYPDSLEQTLQILPDSVKSYIFISTCSVYDNTRFEGMLRDEEAPVYSCTAQERTDRTPSSYGNRKAECERILSSFGIPHWILRPALVYGKYDHTDRLYYWLHQVKTYDQLLLPEAGHRKFSLTYVEDLVYVVERLIDLPARNETFNITSYPLASIAHIVDTAATRMGRSPEIKNADKQFLHENRVGEWADMPLWLQSDYFTYGNHKIREALDWSPSDFESTIRDTISYYQALSWPKPEFGMSETRKKDLLARLQNQS